MRGCGIDATQGKVRPDCRARMRRPARPHDASSHP